MGRDKSLLCYHGAVSQREYLWRLAGSLGFGTALPEPVFSLNEQQSKDPYYALKPVVVDSAAAFELGRLPEKRETESPEAGGLGPMLGIASVMRAYPLCSVLALACDMPNINKSCLQNLMARRRQDKFATLYTDAGFLQPLCAIYEARAASALAESLKQRQRSLQRVLRAHDCEVLEWPGQSLRHDGESSDGCFLNINTPAEFASIDGSKQ